ncbi:hypothetical protein IV203_014449 [Nitzschia inconspicua]|uniref:Uncharacterized protein n=1 Tax=Nitzschia inconspicua TaxID=303405 RepID=A0A9K3L8Z6_9STRA|nr:hypothetical protein IV203_014449 [Nitzschia inconspicua]
MENLDNNTISSINIHLDSQSTRPLLLMPKFEWTGPGERRWKHGWLNETSSERSCKLTEKHLFRKLFEYIHRVQTPDNTTQGTVHHKKTKSKNDEIIDMSNTIFMDMGHFHNRGHVLECLAYMLQQKLTLIRIRRNRHQIANSFAAKFETPCIRDHEHIVLPPPPNNTRGRHKRIAPGLAICPRSGEKVGPVYLKVPGGDTVWDDILTPFQRFLWYADEMEFRWNMLRKYFNENKSQFQSPIFLEVTWSTPDQLFQGTNHVRASLGCSPLPRIPMSHNHTRTQVQAINCTEYIVQDWEYQQIIQYDKATRTILLGQPGLPQFLDSDKCAESREELEAFVLTHMPPSLKA